MKTITFYADSNREPDNLLHIETDGCVVNIHVGLHDSEGRAITRVDVMPDGESRGGDGMGNFWEIHPEDGNGVSRVVRVKDATTQAGDEPYVSNYGDGLPEVNIDGDPAYTTIGAEGTRITVRSLIGCPPDRIEIMDGTGKWRPVAEVKRTASGHIAMRFTGDDEWQEGSDSDTCVARDVSDRPETGGSGH